ncbi:Rv1535 domain-containing protein [Mycobacterium paraterrae]|uniref:Rv1535 domain-containing protein n=1 Tax=Mycobacterium paraterrae TaxID=577492 RepID=A0ABY3VSP9_9MYCO|nr:Rv1535 domain-containing protein [Mycobacterium paraterrae]UMB72469.1 Rv1535 domain-containing protein [Mycobacterium paraterrae]
MSTTDALADPLGGAVAGLLTVPLTQLYAALWRLGAVEVVSTRSDPSRSDSRTPGPRRPQPQSQPRLSPAPAPRRAGRAEYSRATG